MAVTPACQLAEQLVAAWGELRQLEALLASLRATIAAGPAQPPLASILCARAFLATLAKVLAVTMSNLIHDFSLSASLGPSLEQGTRGYSIVKHMLHANHAHSKPGRRS
jgi:hypothetical protein